jgi:hypothetical protein
MGLFAMSGLPKRALFPQPPGLLLLIALPITAYYCESASTALFLGPVLFVCPVHPKVRVVFPGVLLRYQLLRKCLGAARRALHCSAMSPA